ncbi:MAG: hypothetical protein CMG60_01750 [Candidatus Marinimicrobia bacterium]|nr:hypothetical protein [Candidatus Neomarinimicrobiota bacterium]|tara:strand:+ start:4550 stop:8014 length:3465 start_codon:yes stop_codon:yes gene_type:complete
MKYLQHMVIGTLMVSGVFAKGLAENQSWNNFRAPRLMGDAPAYSLINIGNFGYWQKYDAYSAHTPSGNSGGIYPRGTAANIYLDGVLVGGYTGDLLHVSGSIYTNGMVSGYIDESGNLQQGGEVRLYRIRKDWETLTADQVRQDAAEIYETTVSGVSDAQIQAVMDQYEEDWNNWPTHLGAPFYDLDGDGVYEPADGETPGVANADQVIWYVASDADVGTTSALYGCTPIGIEVQYTLWGYNQPGAALGQIVFKNIRVLNKGSEDLTDAYISLWSDPDVGDYTNDFVGVDTSLSMMFSYNGGPDDGDYAAYGLAPAAVGYDFFAGPIVESAGDTAIFNLQKRPGYKNLPASSFGYFVAGGVYSDPGPYGDVEAAREYYNLMRGFAPTDDLDNPTAWIDSSSGTSVNTKFPLAGDPLCNGTGDCTGNDVDANPADRRMLINAGPFTLAVGDTQDVVTAVIGGIGDSWLTSVTDVKNTDAVAQTLFDDLFQSVPSAPPAPVVVATPFEDQVLLDWSGLTSVSATESSDISGYAFEGYNVYQLPSASSTADEAIRIGTFDVTNGVQTITGNVFVPEYGTTVEIPVQYGLDKGVKRQLLISEDYLNGGPLYPGSEYYYAVTAYNYNADPPLIEDKALETALTPIYVRLQDAAFGTRYSATAGEGLEVTHTGPGQGEVSATVTNPAALTGNTYRVSFVADTSYTHLSGDDVSGTLWTLDNLSTGAKMVNLFKQGSNQLDSDQPIVDGVQVIVSGPLPNTIVEIDEYASWPSSATLVDGSTDSHLAPSLSQTGGIWDNRAGAVNLPSYARDYDRFDYWGFDDVIVDFGDSSLSWEYYSGWLHTDSTEGSASYGEPVYQPFAMYRVKPFGGDTIRLFVGFWDYSHDGKWNVNSEIIDGEEVFDWVCPTYGSEAYEPIYAIQGYDVNGNEVSYDPAKEAEYISYQFENAVEGYDALNLASNSTWGNAAGDFNYPFVTAMLLGAYYGPDADGVYGLGSSEGGVFALPQAGNYDKFGTQLTVDHYFKFQTAKGNTTDDMFEFTTSAPLAADSLNAMDLERINVFPNPYYASNSQETNRFDQFVTFSHLPDDQSDVTIKIYSIDGVLVRKLESKQNQNQYLQWDLRNNSNLPVASGPYVAHVNTVHGERVLKLFIIQRNQVVQYY